MLIAGLGIADADSQARTSHDGYGRGQPAPAGTELEQRRAQAGGSSFRPSNLTTVWNKTATFHCDMSITW